MSALSVALYGMFIAILIPPARKDKPTALAVVVSFALSLAFGYIPFLSNIAEGTKTLILTVVIASAFALLFPRRDDAEEKEESEK